MLLQLPVKYAQAASSVNIATFGNAVNPIITNIVYPAIELMFAIAIVVFAYGVSQVIWGGEESRKKGKISMLSGAAGMFVMVAAWGIIYLISNTVKQF